MVATYVAKKVHYFVINLLLYDVYTLATASKSTSAKKRKKSDSSDDGMYLATYMYIRLVSALLTQMTH